MANLTAEEAELINKMNPIAARLLLGTLIKTLQEALDAVEAGEVAAGSISTTELADGALAASAAGRDKMADAFFTEAAATAKFVAQSITGALLKDADIGALKLAGSGAFSDSVLYPKTTSGVQTLIPAVAGVDRTVIVIVDVTTTFDAGDGAAPIFDVGETDTPEKWVANKATGTAGDQLIFAGKLTAAKALLVGATAATGTTSAGAIRVTALVLK